MAVGLAGVPAGDSAPSNSCLFPLEHLSRLGFSYSSSQSAPDTVETFAVCPSRASFPGMSLGEDVVSRLTNGTFTAACYASNRACAGKWKIQNSSPEHNSTFFFSPLLGAAESLWRLAYVWQCLLLLGMLKIPATIFPFHIPKYINVLLL